MSDKLKDAARVKKLPVWAQRLIAQLEREVEAVTERVSSMAGEVKPTAFLYYSGDRESVPLDPKALYVNFKLTRSDGFLEDVHARIDSDGHLAIQGDTRLGSSS